MSIILRFRNRRRRLITNKRAFSSIAGAIFAVLVIFSLASTVFVWSLNQNTRYNNAVTQKNQMVLDQQNENLEAKDAIYYRSGNVVSVSVRIENHGPLPSQILTLWVSDATTGAFGHKSMNISIAAGDVMDFSMSHVPVTMEGSLGGNDTYTSWFITNRGNTVPCQVPKSDTVIMAHVAAGIGSIAMDSKTFTQYTVTNGNLGPNSSSYIVSRTPVLAFSVFVTNWDSSEKEITLNSRSCFWVINPPASNGAIKGYTWNIAKINGNAIAPLSGSDLITLPYGVATKIYFYYPTGINQVLNDGAAAVNLLLIGTIQTNPIADYGQNLPFISISIVP